MNVDLGLEVGTARLDLERAAGRGCPAGGTSRRWRCTRRVRVSPMPSMRLVSSRPARPTNGSPVRSSCSPGPSPTNMRSACGIADAEHDLRAGRRPAGTGCTRAPRARGRRTRRTEVVPAATRWRPGCQGASRWYATESRIASAVTSVTSTRRRSRCRLDRARSRTANAMSPSWRVCDGWIARARPWCALWARRWHSTFVAPGVGGDDAPAWCWSAGPPRRAPDRGSPARRAARRIRRACAPSLADDVADRVHHHDRADHDVAVAC